MSTSNSNTTSIPNNSPPARTISLETGSPVEWYNEENYMLRLSALQPALLAHYSHTSKIFPTQHHHDIVQILSSGPLEDLSISRPRHRLSWGVPVPDDPDQTVYVWFDALLGYLSGIGYPWQTGMGIHSGWPVNLQIIGKDILRSVSFCPYRLHTTEQDTVFTLYISPLSCLPSICRCRKGF
jgi:methionyl-tRNA synthetase